MQCLLRINTTNVVDFSRDCNFLHLFYTFVSRAKSILETRETFTRCASLKQFCGYIEDTYFVPAIRSLCTLGLFAFKAMIDL